jgi:hypothetical protein
MDRSLRFRVCPCVLRALFRLAFAPAPALKALTSHARSNSPDHNAKGTPSPRFAPKSSAGLRPLVCTRFQVLFHSPPGVLFTFPSRYSSLSVTGSYLALEDGPPRFERDFSCPALLGCPASPVLGFRLRDSHPLRSAVPGAFGYPFPSVPPGPATPQRLSPPRFGLFPFRSPLLRESQLDFSSSGYLDVSVPRVGLPSEERMTGSPPPGFPIRTSPDPRSLAAPRSFSQLATSFLAGLCLGIHRAHFLA